jgi:hypothetical protein
MPSRLTPLSRGEYARAGYPTDDETAGARRELVGVIHRCVPEFFGQLKDSVFPNFELRFRELQSNSNLRGWLATRDFVQSQLIDGLILPWARQFNAGDEGWVLRGALATLVAWFEYHDWLKSADTRRFCNQPVDRVLLDYVRFEFVDVGWGPQFEKWAAFRARVRKRFEEELKAYECYIRSKIESRGGQLARYRYSAVNLEWFALYQLRGLSSTRILKEHESSKSDASTILKGIKTAATVLGWMSLRTESPSSKRIGKSPSHRLS